MRMSAMLHLAAVGAAAVVVTAFAQQVPTQATAAVPTIKLTHGYNPLHDESMPSNVVTGATTGGRVHSIINTGTGPIRDQDEQYVCEVILYMDGTKVLRVGAIYIELRGVELEGVRSTCATRQVLRRPRTAADDDKPHAPSNFETCPAKLASLRGKCQSDKDTCCTRPNALIHDATVGGR